MRPQATLADLQNLALSLALGLLVGLERHRAGKELGMRTFAFTALAGTLAASVEPAYRLAFMLAVLGFTALLVVVNSWQNLRAQESVEITTSVALLLTALNGMLVGHGEIFTPVAATLLMVLLLSWKEELVGWTALVSRDEVHAAIYLGVISFVILPVLPREPVDPWGLFDLRRVWFMVVLISAIGFANYVLLRVYGARGVAYTGFLGGLVNSTATVAEMAVKVGQHPQLERYAFRGVMLAKAAMFLRNGLILGLFAPAALPHGLLPVALMTLVTLVLAARAGDAAGKEPPAVRLASPFSLRSALEFGLLFLILNVVATLGQRHLGAAGFYVVSLLGGMVSSASSAATAANLAAQSRIATDQAAYGTVLASVASALVLVPITRRGARGTGLTRRLVMAIGWMLLAGVVAWAINPFFLAAAGFGG
ncbi:MAG: MgtC/SapB family protein [Symbiobacteriaceae bacterium]